MATEAEIVDAKIKLKEANDVVNSIIDRYVRNSMAGIAGEKNEYVLSDMLLRGKIDVSEIGDEFGYVRIDESVNAEEMDSSHSAESGIVDEKGVAQHNEKAQGDELGAAQQAETEVDDERDVAQQIENEVADEHGAVQQNSMRVESDMAASADTKLESALTSVFDNDKAKASQDDLNAGGVVNGAQDDDFMAQIRAMQNQMQAEKEGAAAVDVADNTYGDAMGQADLGAGNKTESSVRFNEFGEIVRDDNTSVNTRDVSGAEAGQDIPTFTPPVMDDEIPTFTPPENQAENGAGNGVGNVDENVNKLGADNGNGEKVEDSKAAEVDNNKEFKPIDFSFEDENEVAAEAENEKQAELGAEAASGRVDNLSDDALERLKASLKVAGEEERER